MSKFKHLVASGCSFSANIRPLPEYNSWPNEVARHYDLNLINTALSSQGNSLIARKAIYAVDKLLKDGVSPEDILVGFFWSGSDRTAFYSTDETPIGVSTDNYKFGVENPTRFVPGAIGGWKILNMHWDNEDCLYYYGHYHHEIGGVINTLERIQWTQLYLESKGIKYFMSLYHPATFAFIDVDDLNIKWIYDTIDWSKFLPIKDLSSWLFDKRDKTLYRENELTEEQWQRATRYGCPFGWHPSPKGHALITKEVIIPWIENNL